MNFLNTKLKLYNEAKVDKQLQRSGEDLETFVLFKISLSTNCEMFEIASSFFIQNQNHQGFFIMNQHRLFRKNITDTPKN